MGGPRARGLPVTRSGSERGSAGSLLLVGVCGAVFATILAGCLLIGWLAVARHAQQAAELAALAGVGAAVAGEDPCSAASVAAQRNDAEVAGCEVRGGAPHVVVEVEVAAELPDTIPGVPNSLTRRAAAGTLG